MYSPIQIYLKLIHNILLKINNPDMNNIIKDQRFQVPSFKLTQQEWVTINRIRSATLLGHGLPAK